MQSKVKPYGQRMAIILFVLVRACRGVLLLPQIVLCHSANKSQADQPCEGHRPELACGWWLMKLAAGCFQLPRNFNLRKVTEQTRRTSLRCNTMSQG